MTRNNVGFRHICDINNQCSINQVHVIQLNISFISGMYSCEYTAQYSFMGTGHPNTKG